jgi:prolyl-tRNA synthetase
MLYSKMLIPTLREEPTDAEVTSHKLMLRAGMIRKLAAGIYINLPLAHRVFRKTEDIIREEMNRAGALELTLPFVQPAEIWQESGRWSLYGKELLRFKDRGNRDFCLGPTHEEVITDLVRKEVTSYRQLPLILYQIHIKFRDEIRPRFGVMRAREFLMKDAYSFDMDEEGAEKSYRLMFETYSRIFERCGLLFRAVEADTGPIGGNFSHEFMVLADSGEDLIFSCNSCSYAANKEKAEIGAEIIDSHPISLKKLTHAETPGKRSVEEVSNFLGVTPKDLLKTLIYNVDGSLLAVLIRGDHELNEVKLKNLFKADIVTLSSDEEIERVSSAPKGFAGPIGLKVKIIADYAVKEMKNAVTGGNVKDLHLLNVNIGRDFTVDQFADLRVAQAGDRCPHCPGRLQVQKGIEVGHIFKLGTKYSTSLHATYLDLYGKEQYMVMGCYGIGVGRTVAAAIEQNNDKDGIIFPLPLAPFQIIVIPVNIKEKKIKDIAFTLYQSLVKEGYEVLIDDRDERPGIKFKDADLIGIPIRITVGSKALEHNQVDIKIRKTGQFELIEIDQVLKRVKKLQENYDQAQ